MSESHIRTIVIAGGGAIGWLVAAVLARVLKRGYCEIRLIDTPNAEPLTASDATNPAFHRLRSLLGIEELDLVRRTEATFNLGTEFIGWGRPGESYFHTFGTVGARLEAVPFHHYWLRLRDTGEAGSIEDFSIAMQLARSGRFAHPLADPRSVLSLYSYGYHFTSRLLAAYLKEYAQARGVLSLEREVTEVKLRGADGVVEALKLDDGKLLEGDLYLDCTPAATVAGRLGGGGFTDWSQWLPCDRAAVVTCDVVRGAPPCSQSIASSGGWQWRIPLQRELDCGFAYCSEFVSEDAATRTLLDALPAPALGEPRSLRFTAGRPERFWTGNCVRIASGSMAPLEPLRLHLAQTAVARLLTTFPDREFNPCDAEEYNRLTIAEYDGIRDFLILHYWTQAHGDSAFWERCRSMQVPASLRHRVDLFRSSGRVSLADDEHFGEDSWLSVLLGHGLLPRAHDPLADVMRDADVRAALSTMRAAVHASARAVPAQSEFMERYRGNPRES